MQNLKFCKTKGVITPFVLFFLQNFAKTCKILHCKVLALHCKVLFFAVQTLQIKISICKNLYKTRCNLRGGGGWGGASIVQAGWFVQLPLAGCVAS